MLLFYLELELFSSYLRLKLVDMQNDFLYNVLKSYEIQHDEAERMYNVTLDSKYSLLMAYYKEQIQIGLSHLITA